MQYKCKQTVVNTCESITNKANMLQFFYIFSRMYANGLRVLANAWEWHTNIKIVLQMPC